MAEPTLFDAARAVNRKVRYGAENCMWKGGRSVASNGYVLIRVGTTHHLADVRGYAYEHRIEAEKKIGRRLLAGEEVHHINGNKQDNRHENLDVMADHKHHAVRHRQRRDLRLPGESNPIISCACGCNQAFAKYDDTGRPRQYVLGHNPIPAPSRLKVAAALASGPRHRSDIANELGTDERTLAVCLSRMKKIGILKQEGRGVWALLR